ncbi:hypothetical protein GO003_002450 [Methylicorpusculum oleiharenae]|uniref:hypothetical protein n=1 Tax=Methylicorpusculum oleiharenae TaxID=1338687 RepID=UPI00135A1225|nr:hypothetical protein [Methylicorpusculum oleiharenae]MCD2449250.1 hypothetical protein [Methylicorpusculum oleiharenae]
MKRNYQIEDSIPLVQEELIARTAYHEAGHAAAIHLSNRLKNLPPVFFQITMGNLCSAEGASHHVMERSKSNWLATVEGGHLIGSLPVSVLESSRYFSDHQLHAYQVAYEADIINILAGPLAEAKHVAQLDDECFNARLINVEALKYYGGSSDLERVTEYLEGFIGDKDKRQEKLNSLFLEAFKFVDHPYHWYAISQLADHILENDKSLISCEDAIDVLDEAMIKIQTLYFRQIP